MLNLSRASTQKGWKALKVTFSPSRRTWRYLAAKSFRKSTSRKNSNFFFRVEKTAEKKETSDEGIQTELHPVKSHKDKDYTFSVWELRFRALKLSRTVKSGTKSLQTVNHSSFRGSAGIQTAPDKDRISETTQDSGSVLRAPSRYIWGLRGHKQDKASVVNFVSQNLFRYQKWRDSFRSSSNFLLSAIAGTL